MEKSNVNNLNGTPNFGHGYPEEVIEPVKSEVVKADEEVEIINQDEE